MASPESIDENQDQSEAMALSAKLVQKTAGTTRNNHMDTTTRTKNSTHAPTSAGMTSPK